MLALALPLLIALQAPAEKTTPHTYSDALAPAVEVAKSLKCGISREKVKAAFVNVRPPDSKTLGVIDAFGRPTREDIIWNDVSNLEGARKSCYVQVRFELSLPVPLVEAVGIECIALTRPDHWGEAEKTVSRIHNLYCDNSKAASK